MGSENLSNKIYDPQFVAGLFDEMSKTYGIVNTLSSFGFCVLWREQCARMLDYRAGDCVVDMMSGMAELSTHVHRLAHHDKKIIAIDFSAEMDVLAGKTIKRKRLENCLALKQDALATGLESNSVDAVVSTFGLKTFDEEQTNRLVAEVKRILKPGGRFAFLEISVPPNRILRAFYMFYLGSVIPLIGRLFLGNPENYRMLGVYTTKFQNCDRAATLFDRGGLPTVSKSFFFSCATGFCGSKPEH